MSLPPLPVTALLHKYHLTPKRGLGQNFLIDGPALENIVKASEITYANPILEIGPGLGSLTRYLAHASHRVVAVELDKAVIPILQEVLSGYDNVTIIQGDILQQDPAILMQEADYFVVANIPYYITSTVIRHLLEARIKPKRLVLTVQKEVAARICADTGDLSLLALSVQVYGQPRRVVNIPAGAFYPSPKVDSSVIRVDLYPTPLIQPDHLRTFFTLAKAGFGQKRKTLRNSLSGGLGWSPTRVENLLRDSGIDPQRRAETLTLQEWNNLVEQFYLNSTQ